MSKAEIFIKDCTKNCSNLMQIPTLDEKGNIVPQAHPWITPDQARKAVEIAREEIYEWLEENAHKYSTVGLYTDAMITDLKQVVKNG